MVLFEIHRRFTGHFLNELHVSIKFQGKKNHQCANVSKKITKNGIFADFTPLRINRITKNLVHTTFYYYHAVFSKNEKLVELTLFSTSLHVKLAIMPRIQFHLFHSISWNEICWKACFSFSGGELL